MSNQTKNAGRILGSLGYPFAAVAMHGRTMSPEHARQWTEHEDSGGHVFRDLQGRPFKAPRQLQGRPFKAPRQLQVRRDLDQSD